MDLLKGVPGSSNETSVTPTLNGNEVNDIEAEMVSNMTEEEERVPTTVRVLKTESIVCVVPVVSVTHISYRLYPELPVPISVCPCETNITLGNGFRAVFKRRNVYFVTQCM
jgi:hypothetical protein